MNESELIEQWELDKPVYKAWGDLVVKEITKELKDRGKNLDTFLKKQAHFRLKDNNSLVDKAFYCPQKNYSDPYNEIEDKLGARFIVLLLEDIEEICDIVKKSNVWSFDECKHFEEDKEKSPLLFTYQSVHYILRPKKEIAVEEIKIPKSTPCELQIRTLLQHAHAELTHDAIYKAKRTVKPKVHRIVAKSMALIEATDGFFTEVTEQLNFGPLEELGILSGLDGIYLHLTDIKPHTQKSSLVIWDVYEQFIDENLVANIESLFTAPEYSFLSDKIKVRYTENMLYKQSTILFLYWMLLKRKRRLLSDWPFEKKLLEPLAVDLGVSTSED